jgi:hypothetical protein
MVKSLRIPSLICLIVLNHVVTAAEDPRIEWGFSRLVESLERAGYKVGPGKGVRLIIRVDGRDLPESSARSEGYKISVKKGRITVTGFDAAGVMYGCLDLAERIQSSGLLPENLEFSDHPAMNLRGTCILLMKLGTYNYPITPEEFPFFYDRKLWLEYLDFLVANRFNYVAFWNGHPFDYFVKLDRYPEAQAGLPEGLLERNHDILLWLCEEGQKRNIRFMFEFYNIHTSVYFQKAHDLPEEIRKPTQLLAEYTSYCIETFVSEFPDVGLYVTAGEALDKEYQAEWLNEVIYPAVLRTGKRPPLMLRSWYVDLENAPNLVIGYPDIYLERKFNVEMIAGTEIDPENQEWAELTDNFVMNIHCIANLEPFRWNPPSYIQKIMQNSIAAGSNGLHLYPRKAWRWPYGCETGTSELQWHRDALWFEMWGRYAWNAERSPQAEKRFWLNRLTEQFGTQQAAQYLLAAFEESADVLPAIQRLFWLDHDNHYVVAAGGKLSQIEQAPGIPFLEIECVRVPEYLEAIRKDLEVKRLSPVELMDTKIQQALKAIDLARIGMDAATSNIDDASRIVSDMEAVSLVAQFYQQKLKAAVAKAGYRNDDASTGQWEAFISTLRVSVDIYRKLVQLTSTTYESISDVPATTPERIPICPYHWSDILPLYEKELKIYTEDADLVKNPSYHVPSEPELAGILYGDPGLMKAREIDPVSSLEFNWVDMRSEKNWSAEWFGYVRAPENGEFFFYVQSDRGALLEVDGRILVEWEGRANEEVDSIELVKDRFYTIHVIYDHAGGDSADLSIQWSYPGQERQKIPPEAFFHSPAQKRRMERASMLSR